MAVGHFQYNRGTPNGALLHSSLTDIENGVTNLGHVVGTFVQAKDGSSVTQYAADLFGFEDATVAGNALSELESAKAALDGISATLTQLFSKFRNGI